MNHEFDISILFALVRAGLFGHTDITENLATGFKFQVLEDVDWGEVYRLAEEQSVVGLVAAGIEWFKVSSADFCRDSAESEQVHSALTAPKVKDLWFTIPQVVALQFIGQTLQIEQRNKAMNQFIAKLVSVMSSVGIYTLLVKGQGVAQSYERPMWRACGDVDFFLSDENYAKAKEFLVPRASSVEQEGIYGKHLGMVIEGWSVELHGRLRCGFSGKTDKVLDEIQNDTFYGGSVSSWDNDGMQVFKLSKENEVFYVFAHFLGHFYKGGIGLRQICDWCRLLYTYKDSLDYELLEKRIKKAGIVSEWKAFGAFAVEYLGMPVEAMPLLKFRDESLEFRDRLKDKEYLKYKRKADKICEFIMEVGNFGHNRDMNYYGRYPYAVRKAISAWWRVKDLCRHARIFPLDSLRFSAAIMFNGVRSAVRGE